MGCIKLFYISKDAVFKTDIINKLYKLIKDADQLVVSNAIVALNEILQNEGGIAINQKMIVYLLNRLKDFDEWGMSIILNLVARYAPRNNEELFDILVWFYQ